MTATNIRRLISALVTGLNLRCHQLVLAGTLVATGAVISGAAISIVQLSGMASSSAEYSITARKKIAAIDPIGEDNLLEMAQALLKSSLNNLDSGHGYSQFRLAEEKAPCLVCHYHPGQLPTDIINDKPSLCPRQSGS